MKINEIKCFRCGKGIPENLYRVNAKGQEAIWACEEHRLERDIELDGIISAIQSGDWLPIASAPQIGEFLVYIPNARTKIQVAKYSLGAKVIGNVFVFEWTEPSHWMPLPLPPKEFR